MLEIFSAITWEVQKEIPIIGNFAIRWYGVLFALGFVIGYQIMAKIYKAENKTQRELDSLAITMVLATIIGARLGHCLFYDPAYYLANPFKIIKVWEGGLASHGAAIGIITALWLLTKGNARIGFMWILDRIVIVIALAGFFIRIGNFVNSEIYGIPSTLPWAVIFTELKDGIPRHPVQLYEAFSYLAIFVFLYLLYNKHKEKIKPGLLFGWFLTLIFGVRIVLELFKVKQAEFMIGLPFDMGQILSVPLVITGIYFLNRAYKKRN